MSLIVTVWALWMAMIIGINVSQVVRRRRSVRRRGSNGSTWNGGSYSDNFLSGSPSHHSSYHDHGGFWGGSSDGGSSWGSSDCGSSGGGSDSGSSCS